MQLVGYCQFNDSISEAEVIRIINVLASDSLKGRSNFTKELHTAAYFIGNEFTKDSLSYFPGFTSYLQPFSLEKLSEGEKKKDSAGNFLSEKILFNVIGVLPGKSIPDQAIIFSAHYDHIGIVRDRKDSICNGANDDASGTTAVLMLAHYFAQKNNNARTLIFCAFAGEELGLLGSGVFVNNIEPEKIVAEINIEMIGAANVSGKNAFFITGANYSNLSKIVKRNLKGQKFKIVQEPDLSKNLFQRSDNFSFAKLGIPAHSFMCSDDDDPCYHRPCDEVKRINLANMTNVIKGNVLKNSW